MSKAYTRGGGVTSLQWVVAAAYEGGGTRADKGEATGAQWEAFNQEIDAFLAALHATHPIAVVIRTIDEEYSTAVSPWHAWSCRELPPFLPFLGAALAPKVHAWSLDHAIDLWRGWLEDLPLDEQKQIVGDLDAGAKAVLKKHGGVPKPSKPKRQSDPMPTLDEMKAAWAAIPLWANAFEAFSAAFGHLWFEDDAKVELLSFLHALDGKHSPENDHLLVEVAKRAIATPGCQWRGGPALRRRVRAGAARRRARLSARRQREGRHRPRAAPRPSGLQGPVRQEAARPPLTRMTGITRRRRAARAACPRSRSTRRARSSRLGGPRG
jgi:hypothetical protein